MPMEAMALRRALGPNIGNTEIIKAAGYRAVAASPVGSLLPREVGEWLFDELAKKAYIAVGLDASDWREIDATAAAGGFGTYGPELPTISGLTWAWDFDIGFEPLGAMRAEIPTRSGTETGAFMHPCSADLEVVAVDGQPTQRALRFEADDETFARIIDGMVPFNVTANKPFTIVLIGNKRSASADQTFWHLHAGFVSGQDSEIANTHRLMASSADAVSYLRNGSSGSASAGLGTLTTGDMIAVTRSNLASDNIGRGLLNAGSKASSSARDISMSSFIPTFIPSPEFAEMLLGAQAIWRGGSSGYSEYIKFGDFDLKRIACAAGAANDTRLDDIKAWATAGYS